MIAYICKQGCYYIMVSMICMKNNILLDVITLREQDLFTHTNEIDRIFLSKGRCYMYENKASIEQ